MFKPFNIHWYENNAGPLHYGMRKRGFTARISPALGEAHKVCLHIAFCNRKDQYCKKSGVETATSRPPMVVNARAITQALAEAANDCMTKKYKDGYKAEDFEYVYKYMV
jgi:hypothetical protein